MVAKFEHLKSLSVLDLLHLITSKYLQKGKIDKKIYNQILTS